MVTVLVINIYALLGYNHICYNDEDSCAKTDTRYMHVEENIYKDR